MRGGAGSVDLEVDAVVTTEAGNRTSQLRDGPTVGSASTRSASPGDVHPAFFQPPRGLPRELERVALDQDGLYLPDSILATSRSWSTSSSIWADAAPIIST